MDGLLGSKKAIFKQFYYLVHDGSRSLKSDKVNVTIDWFTQSILQNKILPTADFGVSND